MRNAFHLIPRKLKVYLASSALFFSSVSVSLSQEKAEPLDPALIALKTRLESGLRELEPAPKFEIPDGYAGNSLILRYKTRVYMVYPQYKTGHWGPNLVKEEGPDNEGILLRVHVQKKGEVNQAEVPQTFRKPYWKTYINVYPVPDSEKQIYFALSYRNRTDKKLIESIKNITKQGGNQPTPATTESKKRVPNSE